MQIINKQNKMSLSINPFTGFNKTLEIDLEHNRIKYTHHSINHQSFMRKEKYKNIVFSNDSGRCSLFFALQSTCSLIHEIRSPLIFMILRQKSR